MQRPVRSQRGMCPAAASLNSAATLADSSGEGAAPSHHTQSKRWSGVLTHVAHVMKASHASKCSSGGCAREGLSAKSDGGGSPVASGTTTLGSLGIVAFPVGQTKLSFAVAIVPGTGGSPSTPGGTAGNVAISRRTLFEGRHAKVMLWRTRGIVTDSLRRCANMSTMDHATVAGDTARGSNTASSYAGAMEPLRLIGGTARPALSGLSATFGRRAGPIRPNDGGGNEGCSVATSGGVSVKRNAMRPDGYSSIWPVKCGCPGAFATTARSNDTTSV
mmetsp:Transcript_9801/g.30249  ORF Transcript_9801/g.30249 Transcript_9801/m.30249 type:complete len:275 (-) Transcript_9801:148-972(-)